MVLQYQVALMFEAVKNASRDPSLATQLPRAFDTINCRVVHNYSSVSISSCSVNKNLDRSVELRRVDADSGVDVGLT
jgi:hypothetical protein